MAMTMTAGNVPTRSRVRSIVRLLWLVCQIQLFAGSFVCVNAYTAPSRSTHRNTDRPLKAASTTVNPNSPAAKQRRDWVRRSIEYYAKISQQGRMSASDRARADLVNSEIFQTLAKQHYFAYRKVKDGQHKHAELLYRRIIKQLVADDSEGKCDHAKLAVATLLLALHLQRMNDIDNTRAVFERFYRTAVRDEVGHVKCACSAKVVGAYALFEMKNGNTAKAVRLANVAASLDDKLRPILQWRQFQEAAEQQRRC